MAKRRIIGVVSQKGGVGKSTLCQLIAREAASQGKAAKILDFDTKQMSSVDWVRERLQRDVEPAVEAEPTRDVRKAVKLNRDYDIIVLDGAPGTPKRTAEMIGECDLIILPTGSSRADLVPTLALARRLSDMKHDAAGPFFALCRVITDAEVAEARSVIGMAGFTTLEGELIERPGYRAAQNVGRSASETAFPSLNTRARKLARAILDQLDS
ncbi:MAG TPA: ParA family protein [Stellaceae bacterium]|jgi:chromosome partitioning protein|nr:ParA family protein [Stellaceae bacterium]